MKKLLILSVLLGLLALPMFASDVTFGGDLTYGYISDFGDNYYTSSTVTTDLNAAVDDYNSVAIEINWVSGLDRAVVTSDIGMWLGLPVGLTLTAGLDDPDANEFESVSGYGTEEVFDLSTGDNLCLDFVLSASMFEIELATTPTGAVWDPLDHSGSGPAAGEDGELMVGLAAKEPIPGLNAEVYYYQNLSAYDAFDQGLVAFDAGYSMEMSGFGLDAGVAFVYDMSDLATHDWSYGVGLAGSYSIATLTVGLNGNADDILNEISGTVVVAPIDMLDIYAGMLYDMAIAEELVEADLGVNLHVGAAEAYLGYLVDNGAGGDNYNAPPGIGDNAAYFKLDIDY
jgi:hypothetical protein